jgi:hypothetical protein
MATDARVKQFLTDYLIDKAAEQFENTGDSWPKLTMDFFPGKREHGRSLRAEGSG